MIFIYIFRILYNLIGILSSEIEQKIDNALLYRLE